MPRATENPVGDFVTEHPWMTFFLGLAALNTVGWLALAGIAAANAPKPAAGGTTYSQDNVVPLPAGQPLSAKVGQSIQFVEPNPGTSTLLASAATTTNSAVLAPAPGVVGGFVAIAPGVATVTSSATGATSLVTVVLATGTAGVGKTAPKRPPLRLIPSLLRVA